MHNVSGIQNIHVNRLDMHQHQLISACKIAKEAWGILADTHEGEVVLKHSKLEQRTTEFENLRMFI